MNKLRVLLKVGASGLANPALLAAVLLALAACSGSESPAEGAKSQAPPSGENYPAERISCDLYTLDDAAALLDVPADQIKVNTQQNYPGNLDCSYNGGGLDRLIAFNLSLASSSDDAMVEMAQYRDHLKTAKSVQPFKDVAGEAYELVAGLGDEAMWTPVNGSLTVRKGNLSVQINLPKARDSQRGIAEKILSRL
ncbi:MAG: hypothetical protein P8178_12360 [Candidatus Thiodiazotropha sp.]